MRGKGAAVGAMLLLVTIGGWLTSCVRAGEAEPTPLPAARQDVELTLYAQAFGLVRETRPLELRQGPSRVQLQEVSKELDPRSVLLRWHEGAGNAPRLIAHAYESEQHRFHPRLPRAAGPG